ncbi:DUF1311 domain-containing protein [Verticiella sediminum]|uniref:DUF1311 domain-containing protein n=1 Tax=Verticiella sediminum TaxID=1247510 RepID=A0A556A802_9BURK|nr:lysozyme inhibitor LprI family protein [Verticiella sediminum]TSH89019.1 DUF1311 domain-containing protein [Verticiella sediminum]
MKPWLFVLIPLFGAPSAWAAATDANESPAYVACMDKAGGVTQGMMNCIQTEAERQDARLNAAYKALGERIGQARKDTLRDAQRAWLRYRDANCAFYDDPDGGTLARVAANVCVMRMSAQRADELEVLARQP